MGITKRLSATARESQFQQVLEDYWLQNVAALHCTICGNCGLIDSRGIKTASGIEVGRLNWCICPNGQTLRRRTKQKFPDGSQLLEYRGYR